MSSKTARDLWAGATTRTADGAPVVTPLFVLECGPGVHLVDLREPEAATRALGYIAGSFFPSGADLDELAQRADRLPVVLLSADGKEAAALARRLETAGAGHIAAMTGGVAGWRKLGFLTTRNADGVVRALPPRPTGGSVLPTVEFLRRYLAEPQSVHWVQMASLLFHTMQSCVDGRDARGVIGTPGGDTGEFALLLAAVEQVKGVELSEEEVEAALLAHIDTFGDFYLHTDVHALNHLYTQLRADPRASSVVPEGHDSESWLAFLRGADDGVRQALLECIVEPASIGCGHLRLSIEHDADYGVRAELVRAVLRSFFRLFWDGAPELRTVILAGDHAEKGVLSVHLDHEAWLLSPIPVAAPSDGESQLFVNHPDVSRYLRHAALAFQTRPEGSLPIGPEDLPALREKIDELGAQQLGVTLSHLASGLPVYDASFSLDGDVNVTQVGTVG